ncbi:hypothetical protein [Kitasatospora sp. NPDC018614]|uniref:hypothetical protein n=1 Tax=Kitasatospora sp. NPDC018614 TaxID=3364026 RepID=UPI0037A60CD1
MTRVKVRLTSNGPPRDHGTMPASAVPRFRYRNPKCPRQQVPELALEPDTGPLRRILLQHLRGTPGTSVADLQRFALLETVYRPTQVIPVLTRTRDEQTIATAPGRIVRTTQVTAAPRDTLS